MKIDIFCAWGDGPDVGINVTLDNGELVPIDLTAAEARLRAAELIACAERAEQLDREYEAHARRAAEAERLEERMLWLPEDV